MQTLTEAEAKRLHGDVNLPLDQCQALDRFIRIFALHQFKNKVEAMRAPVVLKDFIIDMVKLHYGSVEVDRLLVDLKCYPEWM